MRLFQIKFTEIPDYSWARNSEEYRESYKDSIAKADKAIADRAAFLESAGFHFADPKDLKGPVVVTASQLLDMTLQKQEFEVVRELIAGRDDPVDHRDFLAEFTAIANKLLAAPVLMERPEFQGEHAAFNNKVNIHMPGQALSTYNELMLAEDSCTDALQKSLDDGWRIIAALPQPDQRRPDYVMGRFNPDRGIGDSQARRQR